MSHNVGTMSSSTGSNLAKELTSEETPLMKANSSDVGWNYAIKIDPNNSDKVQCLLCHKKLSGGIHRIKQHIAHIKGNTAPCSKSTDEDKAKCLKAIEEGKKKKKKKLEAEIELRKEVLIDEIEMDMGEEGEEEDGGIKRKKQKYLGPMDRFASVIDPSNNGVQSQKARVALYKERTHKVQQYCARWAYENAIAFNAIDNDSFKMFVDAVGQFGPGFKPPTMHLLGGPLLIEEKNRMKDLLKIQEDEWKKNGCSIMTDAWSDRKRRSIMNLCVNCSLGTAFLSSKEATESHTGQYIFEYVDKCIEDVGPQFVVQVVTDNASNNMAAKDLLKLKRPSVFWTSCASHTINLMLQEIGKQDKFMDVIQKAKRFTIFIYAHHKTLYLMRKFTKKRDIVRPGVTRFATNFLTLQSLIEKKNELRSMVTSGEWSESKHSKLKKGILAESTALSHSFWSGVSLCLNVFTPLFNVLRLVDGERKPSMGFVYGEMLKAREEIKKVFNHQSVHYGPIIEVIDRKSRGRLDSSLHLAGYLLNPFYTYVDPTIANNVIVMDGFIECVEIMYSNVDVQHKLINCDLPKYLSKDGAFGKPIALKGCSQENEKYQPVTWWNIYGNHLPELQNMARRVLGLTTSSSGCERAWSTFEGIHTKKRNRLDVEKLDSLVYVQFNARMLKKRKKQLDNEDVLVSNDATNAQSWVVEGGDDDLASDEENLDPKSLKSKEVRELEEDFVSEEDEDEEEGLTFESDEEFEKTFDVQTCQEGE